MNALDYTHSLYALTSVCLFCPSMRDMSYDRVQSNYDMMRLELIKLMLFYITHIIYTQPHWLFSLTGPCTHVKGVDIIIPCLGLKVNY